MSADRMPVVSDLLAINQHLVIECAGPACGHRARWSAVEAVERLGFGRPIAGLARAMKCSACGRRGRDGFLTVGPCTLDRSAWMARQAARWASVGRDPSAALEATLTTLRGLVRDGELGGDGPVRWPVEDPSAGD